MKKNLFLSIVLGMAVLFFTSCNIFEKSSTSSSILIIESMTGSGLDGSAGSIVHFCDVLDGTTIVNDLAIASLSARLIDPLAGGDTYYQSIIVDQIDVEYSRVDGLNQEGVDIPFRFSQKVYARISIDSTAGLSFVIVQHTAKAESPLIDLVGLGQEKVLKLEAKITFHGHDVGGHRIEPVTGTISVYCADYGD